MNTYALPVTTKQEMDINNALNEIEGVKSVCPVSFEVKTCKDVDRTLKGYSRPILPGYLFAQIPAYTFMDCLKVKGVYWPGKIAVPHRCWTRAQGGENTVQHFVETASREYEAAQREFEAAKKRGERLSEFRQGQAVTVIEGALAGIPARFKGVDYSTGSPKIKLELMSGLFSHGTADPLDVRAV